MITVSDAKTYLALDPDDDSEDDLIQTLIDAASETLERAAGRRLRSQATVELVNGTGRPSVWIWDEPESIDTVHESAARTWTDDTLVDPSAYVQDGPRLVKTSGVWRRGVQTVRVAFQAGFSTMPADLALAARLQFAKLYNEMKAAQPGLNIVDSHNVDGWAQTFAPRVRLDGEVKDLIEPYRVRGL